LPVTDLRSIRVRLSEKEFRRPERRMPEPRHCRHCYGGCDGGCLIDESGRCIHGWNGKHPRQFTWQLLLTRGWWHRVLRGFRYLLGARLVSWLDHP